MPLGLLQGCCYATFSDQLEDLPASFRFVVCSQRSGNGGNEGEKCQPLDHMEYMPFIHLDLLATYFKTNFSMQKCPYYFLNV